METSVVRNPYNVLIKIKFDQTDLTDLERIVDLYISNNVDIKDPVVFKKLLYELIEQVEFLPDAGTAGQG